MIANLTLSSGVNNFETSLSNTFVLFAKWDLLQTLLAPTRFEGCIVFAYTHYTHAYTHYTHARAHLHLQTFTHTHTTHTLHTPHAHTHPLTHTTHIHTLHILAHTHIRTHTHTHTHTRARLGEARAKALFRSVAKFKQFAGDWCVCVCVCV